MRLWQFNALDSLFFRGAKPFNSGEGGFLDSQFPPTAQTMAGVIRSAIAEAKGVDWSLFRKGKQEHIAKLIGQDSDKAGSLTFAGPYLYKNNERLYPMPLHVLYSEKEKKWGKLAPSEKTLKTDMGERRLPEVVEAVEGGKPLEKAWLNAVNMQKVLRADDPDDFFKEKDLFDYESRTGIGRDNETRQVKESMLYFTRHIRLKEDVRLAMDVCSADDVQPAKMLRLGGEGRMARVDVQQGMSSRFHGNDLAGKTAMMVLLTHGDFNGKSEPNIEGLEIVSACVGKAVREGGWDYKKRQPKALKSLIPAGSVYFVKGDISKLETQIGERTTFGYGEIAIGTWEDE